MKKPPVKGLLLLLDGRPLSEEKSLAVLRLVKRKHAHVLGRRQPREIKGRCKKREGIILGPGVCLLYHFIEKRDGCVGCKSPEIVTQLNWIFQNVPEFDGLRAEWKPRRERKVSSKAA